MLSGPQPGEWDRDATGAAAAVPGSHAPIIMEGQLYRTNVRRPTATVAPHPAPVALYPAPVALYPAPVALHPAPLWPYAPPPLWPYTLPCGPTPMVSKSTRVPEGLVRSSCGAGIVSLDIQAVAA